MALATPIWSGCPTSAHGSSSAAPSPVRIVSRRWSSQSCSRPGVLNSSAVTSRNDLMLGQLVLDSTALDQPIQDQLHRRWRCSSNRNANANNDPSVSALHDPQGVLRGMDDALSVTTMLGWLDQPNSWLGFCRCCSRYVKTL